MTSRTDDPASPSIQHNASLSLGWPLAIGLGLSVLLMALALAFWLAPWPVVTALTYATFVCLMLTVRAIGPPPLPARFIPVVARAADSPYWLSRCGALLASGLALHAGYIYTQGQAAAPAGNTWALAAGITLAAALLLDATLPRPLPPAVVAPRLAFSMTRTRTIPLALGLSLLALVTQISAQLVEVAALESVSVHLQAALLVAGSLLVGMGMAGARLMRTRVVVRGQPRQINVTIRGRTPWQALRQIDRQEVALVILLTALALGLRLWQLGTAQRLFIDEVHFSNPVTHFFANPNIPLLLPFSSVAAFPYVYPYIQLHGVYLLGTDLAGLRLPSAVFGALTVPALYWLARIALSRRAALAAALLLATLPVHLQFSRLGLNNIIDPLLGTLTLAFVLRGLKYPDRMRGHFAWAGVLLGLTQYFYEGGRLLFPALLGLWLAGLSLIGLLEAGLRASLAAANESDPPEPPAPRLRPRRDALLTLVITACIVAAPVYITQQSRDWGLAERMETAGLREGITGQITTFADLANHFINRFNEALLIHTSIPEAQLYFGGGVPLILAVLLPFAILGLFGAMVAALVGSAYTPDPRGGRMAAGLALLLILWLLLTLAGNTFMTESRISARYVVAFPALALLAALGADLGYRLLWPLDRWLSGQAMAVSVLLLALVQAYFFYGVYNDRFNVQFREDRNRNLDFEDALYRSLNFPDGTMIHMVDSVLRYNPDLNNMLHFLRGGPVRTAFVSGVTPQDFTTAYLEVLPRDVLHAFFIDATEVHSVKRLLAIFPEVQGPTFSDYAPSQDHDYALYLLPADPGAVLDAAE